ncbi:NAD(P)-dependent glycerol-3-phosphate dehydrogenase [Thermosipho ferrireducens]|uniref:Glycerol-3-phosphate dehydrogenase [NAD(P)+] n=1 Tax=Thermosipho ferrireducens TaxID=2571116 RepID=A0ABX7S953_9BACT|nr:NAD(P)H-dependent glycerol-3-phosphate dehydrogenase [Thermosipho ferrireducens]QTA37710.1 NAD(P)-dependent glycerol-3-phosphate dehydrogenase [Thermosipho ferrireducens]
MKYCVLGSGSWGTAFSNMLHNNGKSVILWARRKEICKKINEEKFSPYLPQTNINVFCSTDLNECISYSDVIIIAIPVQHLRNILKQIDKHKIDSKIILNLSKGIEISTGKRVSEIIYEFFDNVSYAVLSGPSHAEEVVQKIPTAVTIAGEYAESLQKDISNDFFRVYTSSDVTGVELAGALKNIMAIAAGILDGLGNWDNAKAALMTRALYEMIKFGKAFGAKHETFMGLSGIGDLMVTCNSKHSRNRWLGEQIAKGKNIKEILSQTRMIAEGMYTVDAVMKIAKRLKIDMPISKEVYEIIYRGKTPKESMISLMSRPLKNEWYV